MLKLPELVFDENGIEKWFRSQMSPLLSIAGPSGVGKSDVAKEFENAYSFLNIDVDKDVGPTHGFELYRLPSAWDQSISLIDFAELVTELESRVAQHRLRGAVISIPTHHVFTAD